MPTDIKTRIKKSIESKDPSAEVFLFGSRARGDNQSDSNWDILILVDNDKITNEIEDKFRDGLYSIELETGQLISIFIYPKNEWKNVLRHTPLFEKRLLKALSYERTLLNFLMVPLSF